MVKNRKNNPDQESHRRYLDNQMTPEERNEYERLLQKDPFAADAADGFASLKGEDLASDMATLRKRLKRRYQRVAWANFAGYAAAVAIVAAATFMIVRDAEKPEMVLSENVPELTREKEKIEEVEGVAEVENVGVIEGVKKVEKVAKVDEDTKVIEPEKFDRVGEVEKAEGALVVEIAEGVEGLAEKKMITPGIKQETVKVTNAPAGAEEATVAKKESQLKTITGKVVSSEDGEPIPGVSIALQGKVAGVVTDIDGNFRINADSNDILRVNFIGMRSLEIPASMASAEKIVMDPDIMGLDEVIVTGTGTRRAKAGSTGSVTVIDLARDDEQAGYQSAMPVGGYDLFRKYISENARFPDDYEGSGREVVRLKFQLDRFGNISEIEVIRSPGEYFSNEAIRLLREGPHWNAASMDGTPITGRVTIRVVMVMGPTWPLNPAVW